uniref:Uncharacterized protein n=1 Tax=Setaria digitata TaxID=48799 RepID=A0A915PJC5_9BILA
MTKSDDDSESDPELREPQVKRRRVISSGSDKGIKEYNELIRGDEEDIIPFAEEEYESIDCNTMSLTKKEHFWNNEEGLKLYDSTCSTAIMSGCSKSDHSDVENSWNANSNNLQGVNSRVTWLPPADVDEQRRYRIHYSPVKSFYKTVPLDEAGATDTEMSRISMSGWPDGSLSYLTDMHALTDSLIVNAEDEPEMDSSDDIKEILSMLNDDENGNPEWESFEQQGTQWREFKYGKTRYQLSFKRNWLLDCVDNDDKHSCDASSEESDDLPTDLTPVTETKVSTPSVLDLRQCSLKRRRRGRFSTSDRLPSMMKMSSSALGQDLEDSVCSQTWSDVPHLNGAVASLGSVRLPPSHSLGTAFYGRHQVRRKLRARRLPRSMSDGEHLGMCMDTSTHSAPGASHWCVTGCRDSDTTGPDQSDAPPYEWDDYKPPAKTEDEWDDEDGREDISVLTIEDDFHMQLGSFHSSFPGHLYASNQLPFSTNEKETPVRKKTARPVATIVGKCVPRHPDFCGTDKRKLKLVKTRTIPLTSSKLNFSKLRYLSESDLGNIFTINNGNTNSSTECIQSFPFSSLPQQSPLPTILSKIEKFASSLKLIHDDDSGLDSSLSTLSSIRSLGDVVSTLKIFNDIHERLLEEQEELQSLLSSDSFSGDFSGLLGEFEPLCRGYEEAVKRVEQFMAQIEAIRDKWNDWAETQQIIQTMIRTIESDLSELRKGTDNSEQICSELELCQERMSRLETACNYLSCNLASLHQRSSTQPPTIDFTSQLALYSNALIQLKTRFEKEMGHAKSVDKATLVRSRKRVHLKDAVNATTRLEVDSHVSSAHSSWSFKALFIITVMAAFAAWFSTTSLVPWRTTLGPHLDYINGPPPL